jgi:hypothetical protein
MGSVYDDCPHCASGVHQDCIEDVEGMNIICTCPICNAIEYRHQISQKHCILTESEKEYFSSLLAWHIEKMTPNEMEIYLNILINNRSDEPCVC